MYAPIRRAVRVLVDGVPVDGIDAADRGFQYGHGMFETCRVVAGRLPLWGLHLTRLTETALRLGIALEATVLEKEVQGLIADEPTGVLKVIVTAGTGGRGYRCDNNPARRVVSFSALPSERVDRSRGVVARICATRLALQPALAGLKHLNRLEQVLARAEWSDPDIAEGLMCDTEGRLIEGTATNLFMVAGGELVTAALDRCGVAGVMRRFLIEQRPGFDLPINVRDISLNELAHADECFLSNAVIGVWPVIHVLGLGDIGSGPGRIALAIRAALETRFGFSGSY